MTEEIGCSPIEIIPQAGAEAGRWATQSSPERARPRWRIVEFDIGRPCHELNLRSRLMPQHREIDRRGAAAEDNDLPAAQSGGIIVIAAMCQRLGREVRELGGNIAIRIDAGSDDNMLRRDAVAVVELEHEAVGLALEACDQPLVEIGDEL